LRLEDGPPNITPIDEDAPLRSVLFPYRALARDEEDFKYNYDKIPVERAVMNDADLHGTVLRLPAVYGPGDRQHRLFYYLKRMDDKRPFILLEEKKARWRWTRGYVENVADAIALAVTDERARNRIYNVGEADALSETEWVRSISRAAEWNGKVIAAPEDLLPEHLRDKTNYDQDLIMDTSRIRKELGYVEKVSRDTASSKTIDWERTNPPDDVNAAEFDYAAEDAVLEKLNM
jgi:nucleoside-diphosphate-sugar epimerase